MPRRHVARVVAVLWLAAVAWAAPGDLDPTFGDDGVVITPLGAHIRFNIGSGEDIAYALAVQPDGKIVAAGSSRDFFDPPSEANFALVRYNPDGSLDSTFGTGGTVRFSADGATARAVVIRADGKVVAAGATHLVDLDAHGTIEDIDRSPIEVAALVLQPDQKVVAAGASTEGADVDVALWRPGDSSFGSTA